MIELENTIKLSLFDYFMDDESFTIQEATELLKERKKLNVNDSSIRARIYEGIDLGIFKRISRGVYKVERQLKNEKTTCLLINGNGRDLSFIKDKSIDGIITDHPYELLKSLKGGNRKFATYELFKYEKKDFEEKQRVLKDGAFCIEFLPEENEQNYEYLYEIKKMAVDSGFKYFAKVPWIKGNFVANTGRKSKNSEDIMFFSKGEPRSLKLDAKKNIAIAKENGLDVKGMDSVSIKEWLQCNNLPVMYMKGTNGMLPKSFDFQPRNRKEKVMEAEKPVELLESIIEYISLPNELLLDQFGGSGNFSIACANKNRDSIVIEKNVETFNKMVNNIVSTISKDDYAAVSYRKIIDNAFNEEQQKVINQGLEAGLDVSEYTDPNLSAEQMEEIRLELLQQQEEMSM